MPQFIDDISPELAIRLACKNAGGRKKLADALGISRQAVERWTTRGYKIPAERVLLIEKLSGVHRSNLRPDLYPHRVKRSIPSSGS